MGLYMPKVSKHFFQSEVIARFKGAVKVILLWANWSYRAYWGVADDALNSRWAQKGF
jgi:hypothetical protein